jgi:hypothetical protein
MNMVRLIYVSHLAPGCSFEEVQRIAEVSRQRNEENAITGALCYDPRSFLQCLEGPRDAVNELYRHIVADERHKDVTLLEYSDICRRDFEGWSMAYARTDDIEKQILLKYSTGRTFDPFSMSAKQARGFMREISKERTRFLKG